MKLKKVSKWTTIKTYVDRHSGEVLTRYIAETEYRKIKTERETEYKKVLNTKTYNYEIHGTTYETIQCEKEGKQRKLFENN